MKPRNEEVAELLEEFGDRLEAKDVEYKPRAYRDAAESVREASPEALQDPTSIPDVGEAIGGKITEYLESGEIEELEELREEMPVDINALTGVEGVGPKSVAKLYDALGIQDLDDLEDAARSKRIRNVEGFGAKSEQKILDGIEFARRKHERMTLGDAAPLARRITGRLEEHSSVESAVAAGSLRRMKETVGDLDVVVVSTDDAATVEHIQEWDVEVLQSGESKTSVRLDDTQIDLHIVEPHERGSALQYFTGSKQHNVEVRDRAIDMDLKLNEYGLWRGDERVAGETEEEIYGELGLAYIPPELREDRGEILAAENNELPDLVEEADVRGDLHTHTDRTDGAATLEEMVEGAVDRGYEYMAVTDHTQALSMVGGLTDEDLHDQASEVERLNDEYPIELLMGAEANVMKDGSLDISPETRDSLDVVIGSIHTGMDMTEDEATERLVTACRQDIDVLGHPSGRLINQREAYPYDFEEVLVTAKTEGVALELNANPRRLDVRDTQVRRAVEEDVKIAVNTDAHHPDSLDLMEYGVATARRGWAEPSNILNTMRPDDLQSWLS